MEECVLAAAMLIAEHKVKCVSLPQRILGDEEKIWCRPVVVAKLLKCRCYSSLGSFGLKQL